MNSCGQDKARKQASKVEQDRNPIPPPALKTGFSGGPIDDTQGVHFI